MSFKDLEQKHNLVNRVILACGKHPTDADINPLLEERLERFYEDAVIEGMAKQMHSSVDRAVNMLGKELAKPEQASTEPPDYVEPPTSDYHNGWEEGFEAAKNLFKGKNT